MQCPPIIHFGALRRKLYRTANGKRVIVMDSAKERLARAGGSLGAPHESSDLDYATAGGRRLSYGCLQRSRGVNETFTSSVFTLQKVLSEYVWHNSRSLSLPLERAHRIFSELKSAPLCTSSFPG